MCVWATWCLPLVSAYHLPTACLGRGSCKVSDLQLRTSGCWGAPNWHSALAQHAAQRWACIPHSTYSTRMRQCIALWSLAWISIEVVLFPVSQLSWLSQSNQFNPNTTLHFSFVRLEDLEYWGCSHCSLQFLKGFLALLVPLEDYVLLCESCQG